MTSSAIHAPRRAVSIAFWALQIILAVFLVSVAIPKLAGQQAMVDGFDQIGLGQWLRYLTGTCELAGGIGMLIPRLRGLAATGLTGLMIGATITNLAVTPQNAPVTAVLGAVFAWIAWRHRKETQALLNLDTKEK